MANRSYRWELRINEGHIVRVEMPYAPPTEDGGSTFIRFLPATREEIDELEPWMKEAVRFWHGLGVYDIAVRVDLVKGK